MLWKCVRSARRARISPVARSRLTRFLAAAVALGVAGCTTDGQPSASPGAPRKPMVAFESIDGMPRDAFDRLVLRLNEEVQTRPLAIASRDESSIYRVKGYLSAAAERGQTSIVWIWDVYDPAQNRAVRLAGEERPAGAFKDAWEAADDGTLRRIARTSLDQLASFLTGTGMAEPSAAAYSAE